MPGSTRLRHMELLIQSAYPPRPNPNVACLDVSPLPRLGDLLGPERQSFKVERLEAEML